MTEPERDIDPHAVPIHGNDKVQAAVDHSDSLPDLEVVEDAQPSWLSKLTAALPVLLCFLGTGRSPWALGLVATVLGLMALLFPPRRRVPYIFLGIAAVITFFTLLPIVPLPWPHWPAWRVSLMEDFHVALPSTWSPQPKVTFENWCALAVMMLWFFWTVNRPWPSDDRILTNRILAAGLGVLAVLALAFHFIGWKPPGWNQTLSDIGPYANRNHFSCLMAIAALLCLAAAYELQRRKNRLWLLFTLGVIPAFAVTTLNTSRAGLVLFVVGTMLWFLTSAVRSSGSTSHRNAARIAVALAVSVSVLFMVIACVVLFGKPLADRFGGGQTSILETFAGDARLAIYAQAAPLAVDQPMLGVGLGNFGAVFNQIHTLPNAYNRYRHPESDWLWFLCEAGWPATFALAVGVCMLITAMEPWRPSSHKKGRRERRLRRAAGLAFLLSAGHGLVDTPNHDLPHLLIVILVGALSLRPISLAGMKGVSVPWLFRLAGVGSLGAAGLWFATAAGVKTPFGASTTEKYTALAHDDLEADQPARAYVHSSTAIDAAPANWAPYFVKAVAALRIGAPESEAMANFGISRYLEPHITRSCMDEALNWLDHNPANALPAWREALRRDPPMANHLYRQILDTIGPNAELRASARDLANRPGLLAIFLATANSEEAKVTLEYILDRFPSLDSFTSAERQTVVTVWLRSGDRASLKAFLAAHPNLEPDTWATRAQLLAEDGKYEAAFKLLQIYVRVPVASVADQSQSLAQLDRDFQIYPSDPKRGFLLYAAQRDRGQWDAALATLEKVAALPSRPKHVFYEMALVQAQKSDFTKAWQLAQQYLNASE